MITYNNLISKALEAVPEFNDEYNRLIKRNIIDAESGNHIVFAYAFTPVLIEAIRTNNKPLQEVMFGFLEEMASSEDRLVVEVCDYSVLEEINDETDLYSIIDLMGPKTREGVDAIKQYMT